MMTREPAGEQAWLLADDVVLGQCHPNLRPRDAATIILYETTGSQPRVLFGRRHAGHVFMANALVFPGGRVDATDHQVPVAGALHPLIRAKLLRGHTPGRAQAIAVAALREMAEETGLIIGAPGAPAQIARLSQAGAVWRDFAAAGLVPDVSGLALIARAVTPPRIVRRFDTRFFAADIGCVRHRIEGVVGPDSELTELIWMDLDEAESAPLAQITRHVLHDLAQFLRSGADPGRPVPFYSASGPWMRRKSL